MLKNIKIVGFDADDTLWVNEPNYRDTEKQFCAILKPYFSEGEANNELFKTEMQNLELYGYGAKGFMLSMIETALRISNYKISTYEIASILQLGKNLLNKQIELLDEVELVLNRLKPEYKLILATKGDLLDQERKLEKSGLATYFHHIEVMSDKKEANYRKLISHLDIEPAEFVMIGNSVKSDILPVVAIGANAIHVPYHTTWIHETMPENTDTGKFITVEKISEVLKYL